MDKGEINEAKTLLHSVFFRISNQPVNSLNKLYDFFYRIKGYIKEKTANKGLFNRYFVNTSYLGRLFKIVEKQGFKQYLLSTRLNKAKKLIEQDGASVTVAAQMTGFNNIS